MTSVPIRAMLFLCSYLPLTLIICVLEYDVWPWWVIALLAGLVGLGSLGITLFYLHWMRRYGAKEERSKVVNFSSHDGEVMSYIASYLIPFVTFPLDKGKQIVALLIFLGVLMIIYVHSNMIYINPVLSILGYHLYEIEIEHSECSHYYIARKRLERNHEIRFVRLSDDIYLER